MVELTSLFDSLGLPSSSDEEFTFNVAVIPGFDRHHLGKDREQAPVLLIATEGLLTRRPPSIILENVSVLYDARCRIRRENETEESHFTVVRCLSSDQILHKHFLHVLPPLIELLGPKPSRDDITKVMTRLIALFRSITEPAKTSVRGIWAELLVITLASDPTFLVRVENEGGGQVGRLPRGRDQRWMELWDKRWSPNEPYLERNDRDGHMPSMVRLVPERRLRKYRYLSKARRKFRG